MGAGVWLNVDTIQTCLETIHVDITTRPVMHEGHGIQMYIVQCCGCVMVVRETVLYNWSSCPL